MLEERQLGVTTTNGLQVFLAPATMWATQVGRWRGVRWGSKLEMAFKSFYQLQPCRLSKLGAKGTSIGGHDYKWPSSLLTTSSCAGYPSWALEGHQLGVTTTNGLQVFLPSAAVPVNQVGHWKGVNWGFTTTNGLQVFTTCSRVSYPS